MMPVSMVPVSAMPTYMLSTRRRRVYGAVALADLSSDEQQVSDTGCGLAATQSRLSTACHVLPGLPARRLGKPWVSSEVTRWRAVSHPEPRQSAQQPVCSVQVWWEQCVRRVWARHSRPMGWGAQWVLGAGHRGHGEATQHLSHPRLVLVSSAQFLCKWQK